MNSTVYKLTGNFYSNQLLSLARDINNDLFDEICISIEDNSGGVLDDVLELLCAIKCSDIKIAVSAKGLIASSAAVLYFFLLIRSHVPEFKNVNVAPLDKELTVIFHRVRKAWKLEGDVFCNGADRKEYDICMSMNFDQKSAFLDNLFDELIAVLRDSSKHNLDFLSVIEAGVNDYYLNNNFTFSYNNEMQDTILELLDLSE